MLDYVFRLYLKRKFSFCITVFSLALAISSFIACLNIYQVLIDGKPLGTRYKGTEVSIFSFAPSYNMHFTLSPNEIINLRNELDNETKIIAASGGREKLVTINDGIQNLVVDSVSSNFFEILKTKFTMGSDNDFGGNEPTCILSSTILHRLGIQKLPKSLQIAGKRYKVVGVVDKFKGLLDSETDIWVSWKHANNILFPNLKDIGLLGQASLYRALIITKHKYSDIAFKNILKNIQNRTDLLQPPFKNFKFVRGITWSEKKHSDASKSTRLYLYISLLIFVIAVVNFSTWIGLIRSSKFNNELTFLKLGISYSEFLKYNIFLITIPLLISSLLLYPVYIGYLHLLKNEPSISGILLNSTEYNQPNIGFKIVLMLCITFLATLSISWIVSSVSNIRYKALKFKQNRKSASLVFRALMLVSSILAIFSMVFAIFTTIYGIKAIELFKINSNPIYFSVLTNKTTVLNSNVLQNYFNSIKNQFPEVKQIGVIKSAPMMNIVQKQNFSFKEFGDTDITFVLNPLSKPTLKTLKVNLLNGSLFSDGSSNEIVVDETIEYELKQKYKINNVVGLKLYNQSSEALTIVGVVSSINYSDNPANKFGIAYSDFSPTRSNRGILVIGTKMNKDDLEEGLNIINKQLLFDKTTVKSYQYLIQKKRNPYVSRILLCVSSAIIAILISVMTLISITNIDIISRKRLMAIYSALGLNSNRLWWVANKGLISIMVLGFIIGLILFWLNKNSVVIQIITLNQAWITAIIISFFLMLLIAILCTVYTYKRVFAKYSIYHHLKVKE